MKKILFILLWIASLIFVSIYTNENPEMIQKVKIYFKKDKYPSIKSQEGDILRTPGNSFIVEFTKKISLTEKTAFIIHDENILNFDENILKIYFQNGHLYKKKKIEKLNLPKTFTKIKNGGLKTIFVYKNNEFGLISSQDNKKCFYAAIVSLNSGKELLKTKCLPDKNIDFNGLGSSHIHTNDKIYLSIGAPEKSSSKIRELAQNENSMFGKIIQINKSDLDKIIEERTNNLQAKIFTAGHRNPQGLTKIKDYFFAVEHGPKGGDELNKIKENRNYGWPKVSYGTRYVYDEDSKAYEVNHEKNKFEEPLFALVPSVGISALNNCPKKLKQYYKKPCLLALSLYGNSLRPGRSIIIFLLNEEMSKVHSIEKIHLRENLKLRHFVTNKNNELYEDSDGSIYVSADENGIYKISFIYFRD